MNVSVVCQIQHIVGTELTVTVKQLMIFQV